MPEARLSSCMADESLSGLSPASDKAIVVKLSIVHCCAWPSVYILANIRQYSPKSIATNSGCW